MTNQQILEKAIQKAIDGGWNGVSYGYMHNRAKPLLTAHEIISSGECLNDLIFNHDFAKALWGEKWLKSTGPGLGEYESNKGWRAHLQQMVIAEDPIKYLGGNLD